MSRRQEIMALQKLLLPILDNKEIAIQDKNLVRIVLKMVTSESISLGKGVERPFMHITPV